MTLVTRMTQASAILTPTAHIRPSSVWPGTIHNLLVLQMFQLHKAPDTTAATAQTEMESDHFFSLPAPVLDPDTGRPWMTMADHGTTSHHSDPTETYSNRIHTCRDAKTSDSSASFAPVSEQVERCGFYIMCPGLAC